MSNGAGMRIGQIGNHRQAIGLAFDHDPRAAAGRGATALDLLRFFDPRQQGVAHSNQ